MKFGIGCNFEMLITKSKPKLKSENDLSKKIQFSTDFSQNFTEHHSTIALPWQQWMFYGTGLYSEFKGILKKLDYANGFPFGLPLGIHVA